MSDQPSLSESLRVRLECLQQDLGTMRLRDEQREMAYQAMFQALTLQIVELAGEITNQLDSHTIGLHDKINDVMARFETRLMERLAEIEQRLPPKSKE